MTTNPGGSTDESTPIKSDGSNPKKRKFDEISNDSAAIGEKENMTENVLPHPNKVVKSNDCPKRSLEGVTDLMKF